MHKSYFDFHGDLYLQNDIRRIQSHLHDILLRIILKMLCYNGRYKSPISYTPVTLDWVEPTYMFSWNEIQGKYNEKLKEFMLQKLGLIDLGRNGKMIKIDNRTLRMIAGAKSLSLELNDKENEAILNVDNNSSFIKFIAKKDSDKLNIYLPTSGRELGYTNS